MLRCYMLSLGLALALVVSVPAAAETGSDAAASGGKADDDRNATVCKTFKVTGSRLAKERVCKTKQQWDEDHNQLEQQLKLRTASGDKSN